jgi:hypothetical protein
MPTYIYHQLTNEAWELAKAKGLLRNTRGDKGQDEQIIKTDKFLDTHVPQALQNKGVSRCNTIYGYLGNKNKLIDIQSGSLQPITQIAAQKGHVLLRLEVELRHCWVSDLDLYDAVKHANEANRKKAAVRYWNALRPLADYKNTMSRPEIMITIDIPPSHLQVVK